MHFSIMGLMIDTLDGLSSKVKVVNRKKGSFSKEAAFKTTP